MTGVRAARGGWVVALAVALAGCSASPAKQDKQNVQKARSILAEWAMLAESRQAGSIKSSSRTKSQSGCSRR